MNTSESDAISFLKLTREGKSPAENEKIKCFLSGIVHALRYGAVDIANVPTEKGEERH